MIKHSENRFSKYSTRQMFELVADIEAYPIFLPWCNRVEQTMRYFDEQKKCDVVEAEMCVSFRIYRETFSSKVLLDTCSKEIIVEYLNGPFNFLNNKWSFTNKGSGCVINFDLEFEFKSKFMQRLIGVVFNEAMRRIVTSFEKRADELYDR